MGIFEPALNIGHDIPKLLAANGLQRYQAHFEYGVTNWEYTKKMLRKIIFLDENLSGSDALESAAMAGFTIISHTAATYYA